jgi:predicted DCC family thiol-disulfide oxidoreductase YuxK
VAALQSRVGQVLLSRLPTSDQAKVITLNSAGGAAADNNKSQYKSIVVVGPNKTWLNSAACLKIGRNLKGPLHYLALLAHIIPSFLRDPVYKLLSRYRTKLFGESPECRLWDDNWDTRFVDDGLFGGRSESDMNDPFADPNAPKVAEEVVEEDVDLLIGPNVHVGDMVRIVSTKPIVHTHVEGYKMNGLCSVGLVGRVTRVLESRAYPKNVAVRFDNVDCGGNGDEGGDVSSSLSFEAHFFPGQLRKE